MELAVEMRGIYKYFPSTDVLANNNVDFDVVKGEVHALVGENGAGKTTLMNVLYGLLKPDSGTIAINSKQETITHPDDAIALGIGMVHQHFKLADNLTVLENVILGAEPRRPAAPVPARGRPENAAGWALAARMPHRVRYGQHSFATRQARRAGRAGLSPIWRPVVAVRSRACSPGSPPPRSATRPGEQP